jgi:hypothetical protein
MPIRADFSSFAPKRAAATRFDNAKSPSLLGQNVPTGL